MNIRMVRSSGNGIWYPQIVCDICEKPIVDVNMAIAVWYDNALESAFSSNRREERAWVMHKGDCDRAVTALHDGQYDLSMELSECLWELS